ncbi:MAG: hypothetical protein R3C59_08235 [Planctomycetaceae bacterium]
MNRMLCSFVVLLSVSVVHADDIEILKSVGSAAEGAAAARAASAALVKGGAKNLLPVLKAFNGSSVLATNWLRATFESIADAELKAGGSLPKDDLIAFVKSTSESPVARRLAYEWLLKRSPQLEESLIPNMLLDPSPEFRRDAVARIIEQAKTLQGGEATELYRKALSGAVHEDQVKIIAKSLREAGDDVDLQQHFGFLAAWKVIGPFDNKDMKGFPVVYEPEKNLDMDAEYDGQLGKVKWAELTTDDDYGIVDIGKEIENFKGSVMYATTTFNSDKEQTLELRLGTPNAWKLWVNGALVFEREEYHRGTRMDQYRVPVKLEAGPNTILLKICQNEQDQPWAQDYQFQLRVCDNTGSGVK